MKHIVLVLSLLCGSASFAKSVPPSVERFSAVTEKFFRGGRPKTEAEVAELARFGIKIVINIQGGDYQGNQIVGYIVPYWEDGETPAEIDAERTLFERYGIEYHNFPINSLKPLDFSQSRNIERLLNILRDPQHPPVYLHCAHGVDRTGMIVGLYRMSVQGWSAEDAYAEYEANGHGFFRKIFTWPMDAYFFKYARWLKKKLSSDSNAGCDKKLRLAPSAA